VIELRQRSFSYYLGHTDALCLFTKDPECKTRKENFKQKFQMENHQDYFNMGFQQSFTAYNGKGI
jgi:hypothetical protein